MDVILLLIAAMMGVGLLGLAALFWAIRSGQYEDLDGAAHRILDDDDAPKP